MRLSFSTRGWGDVPWDELVSTAGDMGFAGIEAYDVLANRKFSGKGGPFDPYNQHATARDLRSKGLQMPVLDSSIDISQAGEAVENAKDLIDAAMAAVPTEKGRESNEDFRLPYEETKALLEKGWIKELI